MEFVRHEGEADGRRSEGKRKGQTRRERGEAGEAGGRR